MSSRELQLLFNKFGMHAVMDHQLDEAAKAVAGYDADRLLNTPTDDLVPFFYDKYQLEVPTLHKDRAFVEQREGQVPVVDYFTRDYGGDPGVRHVTGTLVELTVPFSGDR